MPKSMVNHEDEYNLKKAIYLINNVQLSAHYWNFRGIKSIGIVDASLMQLQNSILLVNLSNTHPLVLQTNIKLYTKHRLHYCS